MQENRTFQSDWEEKYFQVEKDGNARCHLCPKVVCTVKSFDVERHYKTHSAETNCYKGDSRKGSWVL